MFEMLMLLGFVYAGFCHLFPAGKVRFSFGKRISAGEDGKRRRGRNQDRNDICRWREKCQPPGSQVAP
jgi:hypothetical protein